MISLCTWHRLNETDGIDYMLAYLLPSWLAFLLVYLLASLLPCFLACLLACLLAYLLVHSKAIGPSQKAITYISAPGVNN